MDLCNLVGKYQSIKILPSLEESLRSTNIDLALNDAENVGLNNIKVKWITWKKSLAMQQMIDSYLRSSSDPFRLALAVVIKCEEFKDSKPKSLPFTILEVLHIFTQELNILPHEYHKTAAFKIATYQRNQNFFNLIVKTYNLQTIKHIILPFIKDTMKSGNYKDACQMVIALQMQDDIPVEDLLFPMVLQDKNNVVDEYLTECPSKIKPFLEFLDGLLNRNLSMQSFAEKYLSEHNISEVKYDKFHHKPLGKLVARLCSKFKIPIESCKNLAINRTMGGLRYLIHKKYNEDDMSSMVWDDLIKDSLKNNETVAYDFINLLVDYDKGEALKWAKYCNLSDYPPGLEKDLSENTVAVTENWDTNAASPPAAQEFYKLNLPRASVLLIDTGEKFYDMMSSNFLNTKVASIDCEWKPSFGAVPSQVAILQISTLNNIYLLDTIVLNKESYNSFWYTFCKSFMDNAEIIKLGFGFEQDLKELKASVHGLSGIKVKGEGLLDIAVLWKTLVNSGLKIKHTENRHGLTSLVQTCFGLPLDKLEQCSNWELRPLRESQVLYAALDSFVLLEIYYFLEKECRLQGLNFEEICNNVMLDIKPKAVKKVKVSQSIQNSVSKTVQKIPCNQLKLLVEPKLSKLMAYLRYYGIDTTVHSESMLWHDVIDLAISKECKIILSKLKCTPTSNYPQSSILALNTTVIKEQVKQIVEYFQIEISKEYLLQHCIYCNEKGLKKLCSEEVGKLCNEYKQNLAVPQTVASNLSDDGGDYDNYDNFLDESDCDEDLYQYDQRPIHKCVTSKGIPIDNIDKLLNVEDTNIFLCEFCGKLLWAGEETMKEVIEVINNLFDSD